MLHGGWKSFLFFFSLGSFTISTEWFTILGRVRGGGVRWSWRRKVNNSPYLHSVACQSKLFYLINLFFSLSFPRSLIITFSQRQHHTAICSKNMFSPPFKAYAQSSCNVKKSVWRLCWTSYMKGREGKKINILLYCIFLENTGWCSRQTCFHPQTNQQRRRWTRRPGLCAQATISSLASSEEGRRASNGPIVPVDSRILHTMPLKIWKHSSYEKHSKKFADGDRGDLGVD